MLTSASEPEKGINVTKTNSFCFTSFKTFWFADAGLYTKLNIYFLFLYLSMIDLILRVKDKNKEAKNKKKRYPEPVLRPLLIFAKVVMNLNYISNKVEYNKIKITMST